MLTSALQAQAGMAGDDQFAQTFFSRYQKGADAAWAAFARAGDTVGGISRGLAQAANNHLKADHHSTVGASGTPQTVPDPGPAIGGVCILAIDSALGPGTSSLPGPLARFWPNANTGKLRAAATAWRSAGNDVEQLAGHLDAVVGSITDHNDGADVRAMEGCWSKVYRIGDPRTLLAGLPQLCKALGDACDRYANAVDSARSRMEWALTGAGIAIGVTTVVGVLATIFTLGGSDAAAGAADTAEAAAILGPEAAAADAAIGTGTGAAITEDLIAAVEEATAQAPDVQPIEAETTEVEQAVDQELTQPADDMPQGLPPTAQQRVGGILNPDGQLIGQPGGTANCRLVSDQQELDQLWNEFRSEFGPGRPVGPAGQIERIDLGDGDYMQYRPYSKTGGATIDIRVQGEPINIVHINPAP